MARRNPIMQYFAYSHLPLRLKEVSMPFTVLAETIDKTIPDGPEKSVALRKLLESKDAAVRAALPARSDDQRADDALSTEDLAKALIERSTKNLQAFREEQGTPDASA